MSSAMLSRCRHYLKRLFALLPFLLAFAAIASAQDAPYVLHVDQNEVIADLIAVDHNSYIPDQTLQPADVIVTDNRQPVRLTSFTQSSQGSLRPLAVWIIAQCDLQHWDVSGSRFVQNRAATLADGMRHLHTEDTVAAAGWCDDTREQVGKPGHDTATVLHDLEQWTATQKADKHTSRRHGELALQQMLREITSTVTTMQPRVLPVLIFLHQDDTGTSGDEYIAFIKILLEQSSIAYLVTDGHGTYQPSPGYLAAGNIAHILSAASADTGGSAFVLSSFEEHPNVLSDVFATIVDRLHGRYQLSFVPQHPDGTVHTLAVRLSDQGRAAHGGVLLQTRKSYLAPRAAPTLPQKQ